MRVFIDTNLWVYRLDRRQPDKAERTRKWLREITEEHQVVISTQVLIELRSVASRKLQTPLPHEQISGLLGALMDLSLFRPTVRWCSMPTSWPAENSSTGLMP